MNQFIRAAEVWTPDNKGGGLELSSYFYGNSEEFAKTSLEMTFAFDEGLPGKTWSGRKAIVMTDLSDKTFKRAEVAKLSGISCAISIPVFCGEFLRAVLVLFCGYSDEVQGAVEIWHNQQGSSNELQLLNGFYGTLDEFEWISRRLTIMRGRGLPGVAWDEESPVIMEDLASTSSFLRAKHAAKAGITTGLSIPFFETRNKVEVLTLLSAQGASLAKSFEIWMPDSESDTIKYDQGFSFVGENLAETYQGLSFAQGEESRGYCWQTGLPVISISKENENEALVNLPVTSRGLLKAIVSIKL